MTKTPPCVLIVEDHPLNLRLFHDIFRSKGFDVCQDQLGCDVQSLARTKNPSLILLDVLLPLGNGVDIAQSLKADDNTKHIPIVGVTALADTQTQDDMKKAGCEACLIKPFSLDALSQTIDDVLNASKGNLRAI